MPLVMTTKTQATKQDDDAIKEEIKEGIEKEILPTPTIKKEDEDLLIPEGGIKREEEKKEEEVKSEEKSQSDEKFKATRQFVLDMFGIIVEIRKRMIQDIGAGKGTEHEEKHDVENISEEFEEKIKFVVHHISGTSTKETDEEKDEEIGSKEAENSKKDEIKEDIDDESPISEIKTEPKEKIEKIEEKKEESKEPKEKEETKEELSKKDSKGEEKNEIDKDELW